ncbi:Gfo/Idh/MocA family oxidoreductase [Botrimarina sp.]|uniref:Gfo/Idh/MocA family protein n=1 Tax=Botrimarina sp. TaxID=2795802 RepID=UPI0032ED5F6E
MEDTTGAKVDRYIDYRKVLQRDDIDGVVIATQNHWHAPTTIHACQAGKHVYVEKPVCHTIWEGRKAIEAARKYDRVVAAGFQSRSMGGVVEALTLVREGALGPIQQVRGLCYRNRKGIGRRDEPLSAPKSVDYDLWLGPAADEPILRTSLHYDWHWVFNTGNGDMGNQGPHELDILRMVLGDPGHPKSVASFGGRFGWDDAGDTPNMQCALFDFGKEAPVNFEVRNLYQKDQPSVGRHPRDPGVGIHVTCEGGEYRGGRGGGAFYSPNGKVLRTFAGEDGAPHMQNFIDAAHRGDPSGVNSPVESAYHSACLSHLANIAVRCGRDAGASDIADELGRHGASGELGMECFERFSEQLDLWSVNTAKTPWRLGTGLVFDPEAEQYTAGPNVEAAQAMVRREDRKPFVVPDTV